MTAYTVGSVLVVLCAVMAVLFCIGYHLTTDWRASEIGKHLMAFSLSEAAILVLSTIRFIVGADAPWFEFVRLVVFLSFPVVLAWRLIIIWRFSVKPWLEVRRGRNDGSNDDGHLDDRGGRAGGSGGV